MAQSDLIPVVMAGGALGFNWLPVYVAQQQGIFERHGLVVELARMGSVDKATAAVKSGEAQFAITPPEGAIADFVAGGQLRIIGGNVNVLPLTLVAHPSFKTIEDLKRGRLGTSSLTEGTAIYTREMLSQLGLNYPADYSFSVVGVHPARWKALQERTIDAAVQLIPLNFVALDAGYTNFGEVSDYIPEIIFTAILADKTWLEGNSGVASALLSSLIEATDWIYRHHDDPALVAKAAEIVQADTDNALRSLSYMVEKNVFARSLEITDRALTTTIELMEKTDLLASGNVALARSVVDSRHLDQARQSVSATR